MRTKGRLLDIVDQAWREDKLPDDDVAVPVMELPDPEPENGNVTESLREQEQKWVDLGLASLNEQRPTSGNN